MNAYQKTAIVVLRVLGSGVAMMGAVGPAYIGAMRVIGHATEEYPSDRWAASVLWTLGGVTLVLLSKPLGCLLGSGLDKDDR